MNTTAFPNCRPLINLQVIRPFRVCHSEEDEKKIAAYSAALGTKICSYSLSNDPHSVRKLESHFSVDEAVAHMEYPISVKLALNVRGA